MQFTPKRFLASGLLAIALFVIVPYASAHAHPKVMIPAADSVVASPATISVTFSEALEPKFSSLNVTDEQGKKFNTASSTQLANDPKTLTLPLSPLSPGSYIVHWVSVATDGHRLGGQYKFTVK